MNFAYDMYPFFVSSKYSGIREVSLMERRLRFGIKTNLKYDMSL